MFNYPVAYKDRNVNDRGFVNYKRKRYFVGNPFSGYNVGLQLQKNEVPKVWFGNNLLGSFDLETYMLIPEESYIIKNKKSNIVTYVLKLDH